MRQADKSRVRIPKPGKQIVGVEVSTDPKREAFCCLVHFMLLIGPCNPGSQGAIQSQKDVKKP